MSTLLLNSAMVKYLNLYTYDEAGNRKTFQLTAGGVVQMSLQYSYTKLNLIDNIGDLKDNSVIEQYTYDGLGRLTKEQNGIEVTSY